MYRGENRFIKKRFATPTLTPKIGFHTKMFWYFSYYFIDLVNLLICQNTYCQAHKPPKLFEKYISCLNIIISFSIFTDFPKKLKSFTLLVE